LRRATILIPLPVKPLIAQMLADETSKSPDKGE
jgi:hypothetical protein